MLNSEAQKHVNASRKLGGPKDPHADIPVPPSIVATIQAIDLMSKVNARREQLQEELVASQTYITSGYD
jgi:hypothetical protein